MNICVASDDDQKMEQGLSNLEDLRLVSVMVVVVWLKLLWFDRKIELKWQLEVNEPVVGSKSGLERRTDDGGQIGGGVGCQITIDLGESCGGLCGGWAAVWYCLRWLRWWVGDVSTLDMFGGVWAFGWERGSTRKKKNGGGGSLVWWL